MPVQLPNDTSRDDIDLSKLNSFRKVTRAFILPFIESSVNRTKQDIELPYCCRTTDVVVRQKQTAEIQFGEREGQFAENYSANCP